MMWLGPRHVVTQHLRRSAAEEYAAGVAHQRQQRFWIFHQQAQMFRCVSVGQFDRLRQIVHHAHAAAPHEAVPRHLRARQRCQLCLHFARHVSRQPRVGRERNRTGGTAVLGLRNQVGGHLGGVRRGVGNHQRLGRTGQQIDTHYAVERPCGQDDPRIAGSDHHVAARHALCAQRQRRNCLGAAQTQDTINAGRLRRRRQRRRNPIRTDRRCHYDFAHAGHAGRHRGHQQAGNQRRRLPRHVQSGSVHRNPLLTDPEVRHVESGRHFALVEFANSLRRKFDVGSQHRIDLTPGLGQLRRCNCKRRSHMVAQRPGNAAHRDVALDPNLLDHTFDEGNRR